MLIGRKKVRGSLVSVPLCRVGKLTFIEVAWKLPTWASSGWAVGQLPPPPLVLKIDDSWQSFHNVQLRCWNVLECHSVIVLENSHYCSAIYVVSLMLSQSLAKKFHIPHLLVEAELWHPYCTGQQFVGCICDGVDMVKKFCPFVVNVLTVAATLPIDWPQWHSG